jgi:hypothetical protein
VTTTSRDKPPSRVSEYDAAAPEADAITAPFVVPSEWGVEFEGEEYEFKKGSVEDGD